MASRVSLQVVVVALLLIASTLQQTTCSKGCMSCRKEGCTSCFNSKPAPWSPGSLADLLGNEEKKWDCVPKDPQDPCSVYNMRTNGIPVCVQCSPGYAWTITTQTCVPSKIEGCFNSTIDGTEYCDSCIDGIPGPTRRVCVPGNIKVDNCWLGGYNGWC